MQSRGKEILLLALALSALAVALYTFWGKPKGTATPAPDAGIQAEEAGQEVARAPEVEEGGAPEEPAGEVTRTDANRNPFSAPDAPASGPPPAGDAGTGGPPPDPLLAEEPALKTELRLVGIVTGARTLAVIRHGDTRYYVKVGDEIADGYRVEAIRGDREVVLAGSSGTIVLRTGKPS